jgi:hypothetical protein
MLKPLAVFLFSVLLNAPVTAQRPDSLYVSLVAIHVVNLDSSINWYADNLGFRIEERKDFRDHGLRMAFLKCGDVELELVENKKLSIKSTAIKHLNVPDITGFAKVTMRMQIS